MRSNIIASAVSVLFATLILQSGTAYAAFVDLPVAKNTPGCGLANSINIRCVGVANTANDKLFIASGPSLGDGLYAPPASLNLLETNVNNFQSGSGASYYSGTFSDYLFIDSAGSVVIGSRLFFGTRPDGRPNIAEANDIFRYGYSGYSVQAAWTRLSDNDLRLYSVASTHTGLKQGADVYNADYVDFRSDINASEGNAQSGLYLVKTNATAFKTISNAIEIRQGGEEGQSVLSVTLSGYAPTTITSGVAANEKVTLIGGTYNNAMTINGDLKVAYGNATFNGNVVAGADANLLVKQGSSATFNGAFNQQVGAELNGGGTFTFAGGYAPGNSPGNTAITGNVIYSDSNIATFEIAGLTLGQANTDYDHLSVDGNLNFGGVLKLAFLSGFTAKAGDNFDLFDWKTTSGSFASFNTDNAQLGAGLNWDFSQLYVNGVVSVAGTTPPVTPVPEPSEYALMLSGLAVLGAFVRRKRSEI